MFNHQNRDIWDSIVKVFKPTKDAQMDWDKVIESYVNECAQAGRYAFSDFHQTTNDECVERLREARRAVVKFINRSKILDLITLRNTHRTAMMTPTGFILCVSGQIRLKDPTFPDWLLRMPFPRFNIIRSIDGRWSKPLGDNATFFAENEGAKSPDRWHIGYEIVVDYFPEIPNKPLPSKQELERFILDILWMPVLKSQRPYGLSHKLL
jgi:hypothetical protein